MSETILVGRFQQSGTEGLMNFYSRSDNSVCNGI